ncbi:ABC-type transport system, involved in lipoprotein release, permease component [Enhygromyxa salina]|uniref:ABC-type transport system, involved in lipoprotein release, permease component n=1 Tax=Enhygromyxa salina TaxID=215803 RepID=A0A0C2D3T1_9BACT|nr:ABC-type transport system, involved in lipoprotein release, permease component [Enhygromyxa salina]
MAWRNIWRNTRRTLITLFSIAFGTLLAVVMTGIGDSSYSELIDHAARLGGGHVIVQHSTYLDAPSLKKTVTVGPELIDEIRAQPRVRAAVPRVTGGVMLATSTNNVGAAVLGIDPNAEDETTLGLVDSIVEGEMFSSPDEEGIILGSVLAENLGVTLGKKVVYTVTDKSGEIASGLARVSGIITTGATEVDAGTCLLPINPFRELLGYAPNEFTQVAVFLDDHRAAKDVAVALDAKIGGQLGPVSATLPWYDAQPDLAGFVSMKVNGTIVMELIVTVLIAAGIFNTLFVSVMERMRELGIMAAIGFSGRQLFSLVLWESLWLGLCGIVAGALLTAWPYYYLSTTGIDVAQATGSEGQVQVSGVSMAPMIYADIYLPHLLGIALAVVIATMAAGLYPAYKASSVSPVEAIRTV